jgi:hypothetical protein
MRAVLRSVWFWVAVVVVGGPVVLALLPTGDALRPPFAELVIMWLPFAAAAVLVGAAVSVARWVSASRRRSPG